MFSESEEDDFLSADEGESDKEGKIPLQSEANINLKDVKEEERDLKGKEISEITTSKVAKEERMTMGCLPLSLSTEPDIQHLLDEDTMEENNSLLNKEKNSLQQIVKDTASLNIEDASQITGTQVICLKNGNLSSEGNTQELDSVKEDFHDVKERALPHILEEMQETPPKITESGCERALSEKKEMKMEEMSEKSSLSDYKVKPVKESKIGIKKPRERLGERLGNKKLGSRVTKPLVGISSDSIQWNKDNVCEGKDFEKPKPPNGDQINDPSKEPKTQVSEEPLQDSCNFNDEDTNWASWGDWGTTLITAASALSKEMTRSVLETVESGVGAPDPMELAKEVVNREKKLKEAMETEGTEKLHSQEENISLEEEATRMCEAQPSYGFGLGTFGSLVSGVSGALETASNKMLMGGLDTMEKIGRKTMDIIQGGDPGLRRKRNFLKSKKPNLSVVLREARERAIVEEEERSKFGLGNTAKPNQVSMVLIWDNTEGPVHLEALSLVAKQCQEKTAVLLHNMPPLCLEKLQERIAEIKTFASIDEEDKVDNIHSALMEITRDIQLPLHFTKMLTGWPSLQDSLSKLSIEIRGLWNMDLTSIQKDLYENIANYLAQVVGVCHKAAEVALITPDLDGLTLAQQFQRLCSCISGGLEKSADDICESISRTLPTSDPEINATITNIYVQIAEANSYLEVSLMDLNRIIIQIQTKLIYTEL